MLRHHLKTLSAKVAQETRASGVRARTVTVRARDDNFNTKQASKTLKEGVNADGAVHQMACALLDRIRETKKNRYDYWGSS
jgi:impB/mucB/samB family C-terminal domain